MTLPPDRGHLTTEMRHERSAELDLLSTPELVALMADDHRAVPTAVADAAPALARFVESVAGAMEGGGRLIYLGAGTSGRLGVLDASECPPTFQSVPDQVIGIIAGGDAALRRSSEGREDEPDGAVAELDRHGVGPRDSVLGIAAGGTTPYVLGGLRHASAAGALTALLTCAEMAEPPAGCDQLIVLRTGPELLTGSTRLKAGSATKLALNIVTTGIFVRLGKVYGNLMVDLRATNEKLRDRAIRILVTLCPELTRADAAAVLNDAGGDLEIAIVMHRRHVDTDGARGILASAGGLREALE